MALLKEKRKSLQEFPAAISTFLFMKLLRCGNKVQLLSFVVFSKSSEMTETEV